MSKISQKGPKKGATLDTLAQVPRNTLKGLQKRARSKWYTVAIVSRLKYLEKTKLRQYYSHAWNCNYKLYQDGQKLISKYCNTRVCHICTRIRTAKLMNGYVDQIMALGNMEFVTLTVPNCTSADLDTVYNNILKTVVLIIRNLREVKGIKVSGIRKIEITYNALTGTFHPHVHFIVDKGCGYLIVDEWLKRMPASKRIAQNVKIADQNSLSEMFKYTTKIIVSKKGQMNVYIEPLNRIMECLYKRRCFQPFGVVKMVLEDVDKLDAQVYLDLSSNEGGITEWVWQDCDWVNGRSTLSGYVPPELDINIIC